MHVVVVGSAEFEEDSVRSQQRYGSKGHGNNRIDSKQQIELLSSGGVAVHGAETVLVVSHTICPEFPPAQFECLTLATRCRIWRPITVHRRLFVSRVTFELL